MRCPEHGRMTWSSRKGHYCWPCENRARVAACEHTYTDRRHQGIIGVRVFCGRCGDMYVGPLDDFGYPLVEAVEA